MDEQLKGQTPSRLGLLAEIARSMRLVWRLLADPRVSTATKLIIPGLVVLYVFWPADLLPDVLPVLGQLDDVALLALAVKLFIELCPADVVRQHRGDLGSGRSSPPPKRADGDVVDGEYRVIE